MHSGSMKKNHYIKNGLPKGSKEEEVEFHVELYEAKFWLTLYGYDSIWAGVFGLKKVVICSLVLFFFYSI